jgi:hypothetical protein
MRIDDISKIDEEWYKPWTWLKKNPKSTTKVEPEVKPKVQPEKKPKVKPVSPDLIPGDGTANQAAHALANNKNKKKKALDALKKELGEDDIESDIYAQDTWKNDWRKSEEIVNKYFDGNEDYLEAIMDNVTSDSYKDETGDDYFWNKHADIINDNFYGDWNWLEAIQYWDEKDIVKAKSIYSNDFQQNQNIKPGNSNFDDRRRTTEAEDDMNYDISQANTRVALDFARIDGRLYDDILQAFVDEYGEGYYDDWVITANKSGVDESIKRLKKLSGINEETRLNEFTISDLKGMGIKPTREQFHKLQKINHENGGNITRSDLKKVGINEDGVIVPGVNTTVDVQPGQTEKEAAKFGNGKIKPLMPKARKNSNPHKLFNLGLAEGNMEKDKKNPHAIPYLDTQEWKDLHFMGDEIIDAYIKHKQKGRLAGQAIGRAIVGEGDIEADKRNPIAIPHLDNPWWKKLHDMDDKIISAYVKHKSLKRTVGRGIKKGLKKLSKIGSKHTSSSFDDQGNATTNTTYGMANYKESEEGFVTLRKGDKEVKVHPDRVSHFIDRHYKIVKESKPHLLYTLLSEDRVFKVGNIKWDTESATGEGPEGLDLPSSVTVNVPGKHLGSYEDTEEFISNFITNYTGFTHKGFDTNPEIMEADADGDGREDLKGFDAKTQYALKALQAKYPHADNLMSALMAQTEKTLEMQRVSDKQQDEQDKRHNNRFQELEKKLINVIKKNKLTEDIKDREQIIKDYIKVFR